MPPGPWQALRPPGSPSTHFSAFCPLTHTFIGSLLLLRVEGDPGGQDGKQTSSLRALETHHSPILELGRQRPGFVGT